MIYVAAKEQERVSERVSESERGRDRESLSCLYLCAFAYINASIYLSAVATKLISGGFFLPYNRWGNPSCLSFLTTPPWQSLRRLSSLAHSFFIWISFNCRSFWWWTVCLDLPRQFSSDDLELRHRGTTSPIACPTAWGVCTLSLPCNLASVWVCRDTDAILGYLLKPFTFQLSCNSIYQSSGKCQSRQRRQGSQGSQSCLLMAAKRQQRRQQNNG